MKNPIPEKIELTALEAEQLIERINANILSADDQKIIVGIIRFCMWLQIKLTEAKITIRKLSKFFGIKSEKRPKSKITSTNSNASQPENVSQSEPTNNIETSVQDNAPEPNRKGKNNGKLAASKYTDAEKIKVEHPTLTNGSPCPEPLCDGRVYTVPAGNVIRIVGGKMAEAKHYIVEKLRCNLCSTLFSATLPESVGEEKYDARFKATLAVHKYYLGLPFYRIERMQSYLGVPLPDSTQWQLIDQVANCVYRVFRYMEYSAAQGKAMFIDDTGVRIIAITIVNKQNPDLKRTGTFTTAIISVVGKQKIYLFYSSKKHAGENAIEFLKNRNQDAGQILYMCDALASNMPRELKAIFINCLSHARRNFIDLEADFPQECEVFIKSFAAIYKHEHEIKRQHLSEVERLEYHKIHSKPVMDALKIWAENQFCQHLIEPNSKLGEAINYMLKRWNKFTRFLEIPGAALDNNCVEEVLKIPIRVRKNSYFFATEHGAFVGGMLTSLIVTAARAGINPVEYLTALQQYKSHVLQEPQNWLPWNYQGTIVGLEGGVSSVAA